ncbi:MAG TPA: hypothetical protein VG273_16500 [Bryobacteraceae bacterium]|nr:hypothetical protein [Bryobacteraceae bacterium]
MSNPNNPFGFRPIIRLGGSPFSVAEYGKPVGDSNAIYAFDLVGFATGTAPSLPENTNYKLPIIQTGYQLTPGTSLYVGATLAYGAASTATVHPVTDEPDVLYIGQLKTGTTYSTTSHAHRNANVSQTTAGSTTTKQSGLAIDGAGIATTSSLDLRIRGMYMSPPNAEGDSAILEVTINKHALGLQTAGV